MWELNEVLLNECEVKKDYSNHDISLKKSVLKTSREMGHDCMPEGIGVLCVQSVVEHPAGTTGTVQRWMQALARVEGVTAMEV